LADTDDLIIRLKLKVSEQLISQKVGFLLGAGSSYVDNHGFPLAFDIWDRSKHRISDKQKRNDSQLKLDSGARGIEHALDFLDDGGALDTPYRHLVTQAIVDLFLPIAPDLNYHIKFMNRLSQRSEP
jgi:hypothetical protein